MNKNKFALFCLIAGFVAATLLNPITAKEAQTSALPSTVPESFSKLVKKARPSVVNISTVKVIKGRGLAPMPFRGGRPFGPDDPFKTFLIGFLGTRYPRNTDKKALVPALSSIKMASY